MKKNINGNKNKKSTIAGNRLVTVQQYSKVNPSELPIAKAKIIIKPKENLFPERYKIHQYWSRKPWYVVREYIQNFTSDGDLVLDPFSGSGVTACESLITGRNFVGLDINPISNLLTKLTCVPHIDLKKIELLSTHILEKIQPKIRDLYSTYCRDCENPVQIINTIWKNDTPISIFYKCKTCKHNTNSKVTTHDKKKIEEIETMEIPYWYPKNVELAPDSDVKYLEELFTKRNLHALSYVFHEIKKLPKTVESDFVLLMFLSSLVRCSKLIFVNEHRFSKGVNPAGVWGEKRFWIPNEYIENNVYHYFSVRLEKILKAKKETNDLINGLFSEKSFNLRNGTATNLRFIKDNSMDYCFTDPPYGGSVHYLDLSIIWNSWLQTKIIDDEIVVSKKKSITQYSQLMDQAFEEIFRVLKPGKFMSVTFHNSESRIWNVFLDACKKAGFELQDVAIQEPIKISHNQIDIKGTVKTDVILTFQKSYRKVSIKKQNQSLGLLIKKGISEMYLSKKKATLSEIYDTILVLWILDTYHSVTKQQFLSLNMIENILSELKLKAVSRFEEDYKGKKRKIQEWQLQSFQ